MLRCFLAVELPLAMRQSIAAAIAPLLRLEPAIRWVPEPNLHITLKFLGEIEETRLDSVTQGLEARFTSLTSFEIELGSIGVFPSSRDPRIFWLGLRGGEEDLTALAATTEQVLVSLGFAKEEQAFQAHVTLGRAREGARFRPDFLEHWSQLADFRPGMALVEAAALFRSELGPERAKYTVMRRLELGRRNA